MFIGRLPFPSLAHAVAQAPIVSTRASIERTTMKVFDRTFAITDALRVVCLLVAVLGIWWSFAALQLDRQKEIEYSISSIEGKDLEITKENDRLVIRFAYDKEIPIVEPVYLLMKYKGRSK